MTETTEAIRILHVDDNPDISELTATFLEREDDRFAVETTATVSEGLSYLAETDIDCIVSDYNLPGENGIEFLSTVRESRPDLPFILFTGKGSEEVASEAISAGVTDYLQKESGTSQYAVLANRVTNAVEQSRSKRALEASQKRLSLFVEQSPLGVIEWNDNFDIARLNDAAEAILGYTEDELAGETWETIVSDSDASSVGDVVDELLNGSGGYHSINENIRKNGETIVCEWHNRIVTDENDDVVAIFSQFQDITERKNQQWELERDQKIIQAATSTIITVDEANTILSANPSVERTFGHDPDELVGKPLTVLMADEVAERHTAAFERYLETDQRTLDWNDTEFQGQHRDGTPIPLSVTFGEVTYEGDRYFVGVLRDITDRKERERKLEETNSLLSTLFDTLPVGVLAEDTSRNVLSINDQLLELFEMPGTPEDVIGSDCEQVATAASELFVDSEAFVERTTELVADQTPVVDEAWELQDGRTFTRNHHPIELPDGEGHLWVYHDVTDRMERERRLEALNGMTRELVTAESQEQVAEIGVSAARDILNLEASAIHLYDKERSELVPLAATDAVYDLIGDVPTFTGEDSIAWRVYQQGDPLALDDIHDDPDIYNPDTPVRSELYLPIGEVGILVAGSPTPEAFDQQDVVLGEILAGNIATALEQIERTEQVRVREQKLRAQNEQLEEFASVVSHDLRNPLNVATARLALLGEECDSDHIAAIERSHSRMNRLIDDLLALARHGNNLHETEPVDLGKLTRNCWQTVATAEATLDTDTTGEVVANRSRLQQLLENVFRNSVEHGGDSVTVTVGDLDGGFYVEDDGTGIPKSDRETVFDSGYSTAAGGSGFGLSIVEQIANAHDWDVTVTASPEGGARFEITGVEYTET
ncbi:PAS domain S-box protein [Salinibaculum salinum]|uniref:PAS domain S-box protein n=1 Tax=Salinibaculum salinum TaxID=3131996 RepID=UPI0030EF5C88